MKILIFKGPGSENIDFWSSGERFWGGGCQGGAPDSGPLRVYNVECKEVQVCK